jgi:molybdate transport system ATP-binding protein
VSLDVAIAHRLSAFRLEAGFRSEGGLTALFGPSGSGKTTVVNVIAGLVRPDRARIEVDGEVLVDTARNIFVPPHRRHLGYVFQEPRLFPHLTVRQNLLYGRWFRKFTDRRAALDQVVDVLGIEPLLHRRPARLSGGEKQRVAIGRAWLASPRLLLMDEPLSSLDAARKDEILPYIERLRDESRIPIVYVSHAVAEVARLATQVVLLEDGRVSSVGTVDEVLSRTDALPLSARDEAGAIVEALVAGHDDVAALTTLHCRAGALRLPRVDLPVGATVRVRIPARDVLIAVSPPQGLSARNVMPAVVREVSSLNSPTVDVRLDADGDTLIARVTRHTILALGIKPGRQVFAVIKAVAFDQPTRRPGASGPTRANDGIVEV